jgi:hypothetical protein
MEAGPCRRPVGPLTEDQREKLKKVLQQMKVL